MRRSVMEQTRRRLEQTRKNFHGRVGDPSYPHGGGGGDGPSSGGPSERGISEILNTREQGIVQREIERALKDPEELDLSPREVEGLKNVRGGSVAPRDLEILTGILNEVWTNVPVRERRLIEEAVDKLKDAKTRR